jgi:peptidoglycan-N-acetylglucosamine deacetylase
LAQDLRCDDNKGYIVVRVLFVLGVISIVVVVGIQNISRSRTFQIAGKLVHRVDTNQKLVALTFDDGPSEGYTQDILKTLDNFSVKATFFLVGGAMERNPHLAKLIVNSGHEIGNHSYSHQRMMFMAYDDIANELKKTHQLIDQAGYTGEIYFRPPYARKLLNLPLYLSRSHITSVTWDLEPETNPNLAKDRNLMIEHVVDNVRPGSIILMHIMFKARGESMEAIPGMIERLQGQGYQFVTVSELLAAGKSGV